MCTFCTFRCIPRRKSVNYISQGPEFQRNIRIPRPAAILHINKRFRHSTSAFLILQQQRQSHSSGINRYWLSWTYIPVCNWVRRRIKAAFHVSPFSAVAELVAVFIKSPRCFIESCPGTSPSLFVHRKRTRALRQTVSTAELNNADLKCEWKTAVRVSDIEIWVGTGKLKRILFRLFVEGLCIQIAKKYLPKPLSWRSFRGRPTLLSHIRFSPFLCV